MSFLPRFRSDEDQKAERDRNVLARYPDITIEVARAFCNLWDKSYKITGGSALASEGKVVRKHRHAGGEFAQYIAQRMIKSAVREALCYVNPGLTEDAQGDQALSDMRYLLEALERREAGSRLWPLPGDDSPPEEG